ncbi:MAG: hypothetical protein WC140_00445 [Bacteroidales bacterium]
MSQVINIYTRKSIRKFVLPFYLKNDLAHQIDHADQVCDLALKLNDTLSKISKQKEILVILAAYFHDIYARERKVHNELSYKYVLDSKLDSANNIANDQRNPISFLSDEDRKKVAMACLEHRSSFNGTFYSSLSEIISSADRGFPDLVDTLERSKVFWISKYGKDEIEANKQARIHMKEKYGFHGYANYPPLYRKYFKNELEKMQNQIDKL